MNSEALILEEAARAPRMRRCIAARASRPAASMVRFVIGPERMVVPDLAGRLPGRGFWVTADRAFLTRVLASKQLVRAGRGPLVVPHDLPDRLERLLADRCLGLVGLARRAGSVVAGFDQVSDQLRRGKAALVLEATDAGADGRGKVAALARDIPVVAAFDRQALGAAIGRAEIVHIALAPSGLQLRLLAELRRLSGFRSFTMPATAVADEASSNDRSPS